MRRALVAFCASAFCCALSVALYGQLQSMQITLDTPVVLEGQTVTGTVSNVAVGADVRFEWMDPFGAIIRSGALASESGEPVSFSFDATNAFVPVNYVNAVTATGEDTAIFTVLPAQDTFWSGFVVAIDKPLPVRPATAIAVRRFGANAALAAGYQEGLSAGGNGLRSLVTGLVSEGVLSLPKNTFDSAVEAYEKDHSEAALERTPSLADQNEIDRLCDEISKQASLVRTIAPAGLVITDGPSTGYRNEVLDLSFAQEDLDSLASYAAMRLPAAEEAAPRARSAFKPLTALEMKEQIAGDPDAPVALAPWALHREYMDGRLAGSLLAVSRAAKTAASAPGEDNMNWSMYNVLTGFSGALAPSAYGGYDWTMLPLASDFVIMANDAPKWSWPLVRDMLPNGTALARVSVNSTDAVDGVWEAVADGMAGVVLDEVSPFGLATVESTAAPVRGLRPRVSIESTAQAAGAAASMPKTLGDIRGAAEIAAHGSRAAMAAIIYSPKSVRAGWMMDYLGMEGSDFAPPEAGTEALAAWPEILAELGLDCHWISMDNVVNGALVNGEFPMAVLPEAWCVSPEAADALTQYVSQGGLLVADNAAGMLDDGYAAYRPSPLDALFGVRRLSLTGKRASLLSPGSSRTKELGATADSSLVALRGAGSVPVEGAATMVTYRTEEGGTAYLNRFVGSFPSASDDDRHALLTDMLDVLKFAGIAPKLLVYQGRHAIAIRLNSYVYGQSEEFVIQPLGKDKPAPGAILEVRFGEESSYYNLRSESPEGELLGSGTSVNVVMPDSGPIIISRTSMPLSDIELTLDFGDNTIYVTARATADGPPGSRTIQIEFYDPSGARVPQFDRLVTAPDGAYTGLLALPENVSLGDWTVLVRDLETGLSSMDTVTVE